MPKREVRTEIIWKCNLCHSEHSSKEAAQDCEKRGLALPEFKKWDLVLIKPKDSKEFLGEVVSYGPDEGFPDPHMLPGYYDVNVTYRDYNPGNHKPLENNSLRRHGITIPRDVMKPYIIKSGAICPMCESPSIRKEVQRVYDPYCLLQLNFLVNIELSRCGSCGLYFFNKTQSRVVTRKILSKLRGKKLADTKRLAREHEYQYS